ncbi:hypothetical protein ACJJTC_016650 [Scirpophaga incertulas]
MDRQNKLKENFGKSEKRKRGRPTGQNRTPLTKNEQRARNAQYERERRREQAMATAELARETGLDPSTSQKEVIATAIAFLRQGSVGSESAEIAKLIAMNKKLLNQTTYINFPNISNSSSIDWELMGLPIQHDTNCEELDFFPRKKKNKLKENFGKSEKRKRGRPTGQNRTPLTKNEQRARNAQYERERRREQAMATAELARETGLDPSLTHYNAEFSTSGSVFPSPVSGHKLPVKYAEFNGASNATYINFPNISNSSSIDWELMGLPIQHDTNCEELDFFPRKKKNEQRARNAQYERERRREQAMSTAELARETGVDPSTSQKEVIATAIAFLRQGSVGSESAEIAKLIAMNKKLLNQIAAVESLIAGSDNTETDE